MHAKTTNSMYGNMWEFLGTTSLRHAKIPPISRVLSESRRFGVKSIRATNNSNLTESVRVPYFFNPITSSGRLTRNGTRS